MVQALPAKRSIRRALLALLALVLAGVLLALWSKPADAVTFTVNKTGDGKDRKINGVCDSSRKRGKQCTLRAAIEEANGTSGGDTINFNIRSTASVKTISPASELPTIIEGVTINGYSQGSATATTSDDARPNDNPFEEGTDAIIKVQLNGTNAGEDANGLTIASDDSIIKGLAINRFDGSGIFIDGSAATFDKGLNDVVGNFIGTDASGTQALGNENGVRITNARSNTVGGTTSEARNLISNGPDGEKGVSISGSGAKDNKVEGNFIGTTADGTGALGGEDGVSISGSANNNTIGGTTSASRNLISGNTGEGVRIFGSGTGNSVLSNSIFSNGNIGIDLDTIGVTANDDDDPDTGSNSLQNFPVITSVIQSSSFLNPTKISGTLNSNPSQTFTVQCFLAEDPADASGHGEGKFFMAEDTDVTTNAGGDGSFECNFLFPVSIEGKRWSATATNNVTGDTSEFSANFLVG